MAPSLHLATAAMIAGMGTAAVAVSFETLTSGNALPQQPAPRDAATVAAAPAPRLRTAGVDQNGPNCKELVRGSQAPAAVKNDDVENQLSYLKRGSPAPEVFHGIYWMDQTGYYQTRPDRPDQAGEYEVTPGKFSWYKTFPHNLPSAAAELLLSFGSSTYNAETRCLNVSMRTDQWLWVNTTGTATGSVTWADVTTQGLLRFCLNEATREISIQRQPCVGDTDTSSPIDMGQRAIPRSWGLERLNRQPGQLTTRYAAYQIVDGLGRRTQHYQAWLDFMQTECWFSPQVPENGVPFMNDTVCRSLGGWHVNLGGGYSVLGRQKPA